MGAISKTQINAILDRVRSWPDDRQEDAAMVLLSLEEQGSRPYQLSPEEEADLDEALKEMERGEVASDDEVTAVFKRFGK